MKKQKSVKPQIQSSRVHKSERATSASSALMQLSEEKLKEHIDSLQHQYCAHRQYRIELEEKLENTLQRKQRLKQEHQSSHLQKETITMMTKYQLVFSQIERKFIKCLNSTKLRQRRQMQRAFFKLVHHTRGKNFARQLGEQLLCHRVRVSLTRFVYAVSCFQQRAKTRSFTAWVANL